MRTKKAFQNSLWAVVSNVLLVVCSFWLQRVMTNVLGQATIGLNSVFANIVSILSLAELGVATAIVYNLYAPLASRDTATISALMRLFAKCYRVIACVVAALGLCMLPFVHLFVKDGSFELPYLRTVFALFVLKAVCSYFLSYRRSLIMADQRASLLTQVDLVTQLLTMGGGVAILKLTGSFVAYLAYSIVLSVLGNLVIAGLSRRLYPYLKTERDAPELSAELKSGVFRNVKNIFLMRLSGVVLNSTDSLIISSFVGVMAAGLYDYYYKIIAALTSLMIALTNALQPTLGNMYVVEKKSTLDDVLRTYTFVFYLLGSLMSLCLLALMKPFVTGVWMGAAFAMDDAVIRMLCVNFFLVIVRNPLWSLLTVSGLFARDKNISILGAATNLVVSIALVLWLGMLGVFIGTFLSQLLQLILKTRLLYREGLSLPCKQFVTQLCQYATLYALQAAAVLALCGLITVESPWLELLYKLLICIGVFCLANLGFVRSHRVRSVRFVLARMLRKEEPCSQSQG